MERPRRRLHQPSGDESRSLKGPIFDQHQRLRRTKQIRTRLALKRDRRSNKGNGYTFIRRVFTIFLLSVVAWWFLSPIKTIDIAASTDTNASQAVDNYFQIYTRRNILIDAKSLETVLLREVERATFVRVEHDILLSKLGVHLESDDPALRWQTEGVQYTISSSGIVLHQTQKDSVDERLPLVFDRTSVPIELKQQIVPSDFVRFIQELETAAASLSINISERFVDASTREVSIIIGGGKYEVILSTKSRAGEQLQALLRLEKYFESKGIAPRKYVDLRVDDRVYWQ